MTGPELRVLFATPAYWPATAFGGPIWVQRELARRLVERGHEVEVVTTSLLDLHRRGAARSRVEVVDGAHVHYLATPVRYRWMGVTPSLPLALRRLPRPDAVHLFGFRDVVTTTTASWARMRRIPYVLEPLGMFRPRLRKVRAKQAFDATVARGIASGAAAIVVSSSVERDDVVASGGPRDRIVVRGNGFPEPLERRPDRRLRLRLGIPPEAPLVLYVGRLASGKGIDLLLRALRDLPEAQLALAAELRRPVVIHARQADDDLVALLRAWGDRVPALILHSFSGGPPLVAAGRAVGAYFSFSGMITFKNWRWAAPPAEWPSDRLLVETDAPYLAPVPHRGRRNEPAFVRVVAQELARARGADPEALEADLSANARRVFGPRLERVLE